MNTAAKFFVSKSIERRVRFMVGRETDDKLAERLGELTSKRTLTPDERGLIEVIREELEDRFSTVPSDAVELTTAG